MGSRRWTLSLHLHLLALSPLLLLQVVPSFPEEVTKKDQSLQGRVTLHHEDHKEEIPTTQTTTLSGTQNILLQHAVKDLLGFKELPAAGTPKPMVEKWNGKGGPRGRDEAPKYMMKLYEKYKYGGAISNGQQFGNTARSISASIEMLNGEPMFVFNLSSVSSSELVFSSDIHVYRKRPKSPDHENNAYMLIKQVAPTNYLTHIASLHMTGSRFGWQSYDVTSSVQNCLQKSRDQQRLAISFASSRVMTSDNSLPLKHFIRHNVALPFLIVFSNDTQNITLDHIDPHFAVKDVQDVIIDPEFGVKVPLYGKRRRKSRVHHSIKKASVSEETTSQISSETEEQKKKKEVQRKSTEEVAPALHRRKRSIFDNEIPEHPTDAVEPDAPYNVPRTHPAILQGRGQSRHQVPVTSSQQLIPYPDDYDEDDASYRKRRRKERRRNRKKKGRERNGRNKSNGDRTIPFPPEWERELSHQENIIKVGSQDYLCGRKRLAVDFADIGWSDWIISPRSFEAHYCAGSCPFPLTKALKPSNHATIQSLVHAIGIPANVPAPCCVPDSLTSVTLLFFDENRNVVLKNYPAMSVESCACR